MKIFNSLARLAKSKSPERSVPDVRNASGRNKIVDPFSPEKDLSTKALNDGYLLIANGQVLDLEAAERFRMLRAHLDRLNLANKTTSAIAVSSAVPSEGKSVCSVNLARAFANDPQGRSIIVDCDLRKPNIHRFYGRTASPGLSDLLVAGKPLESVIQEVEPGLDAIFAGSPVVDSTRTIESPGLELLVKELQERYAHVILDCPPVLLCSEVLAITRVASSCMLVARAWRTERQLVEEAVNLLRPHNLLGVVLNECSDSLSHYGYYGYYGYLGGTRKATDSNSKTSLLNPFKQR